VVALEVIDAIKEKGIHYTEKEYEKSDLAGAYLVYACTNIVELNLRVRSDAQSLGILVNLVDNPTYCDFVSPAIYKREHITVSVGSNAQEVHRAIAVRNKIKEYLEHDPSVFTQPVK
jgi:precorrin-2 dehydrogenase/sirohydrochlorin ferrochelatase